MSLIRFIFMKARTLKLTNTTNSFLHCKGYSFYLLLLNRNALVKNEKNELLYTFMKEAQISN